MNSPEDVSRGATWGCEALSLRPDRSSHTLTVLASPDEALLVLDQDTPEERRLPVASQEVPGTLATFVGLGPRGHGRPWHRRVRAELLSQIVGGDDAQFETALADLATILPPQVGASFREGNWRVWCLSTRISRRTDATDYWVLDTSEGMARFGFIDESTAELTSLSPSEVWRLISDMPPATSTAPTPGVDS